MGMYVFIIWKLLYHFYKPGGKIQLNFVENGNLHFMFIMQIKFTWLSMPGLSPEQSKSANRGVQWGWVHLYLSSSVSSLLVDEMLQRLVVSVVLIGFCLFYSHYHMFITCLMFWSHEQAVLHPDLSWSVLTGSELALLKWFNAGSTCLPEPMWWNPHLVQSGSMHLSSISRLTHPARGQWNYVGTYQI